MKLKIDVDDKIRRFIEYDLYESEEYFSETMNTLISLIKDGGFYDEEDYIQSFSDKDLQDEIERRKQEREKQKETQIFKLEESKRHIEEELSKLKGEKDAED